MRAIAIDPGYDRCGIAVIERLPGDRRERVIFSECVQTSKKSTQAERLGQVGSAIAAAIEAHAPDVFAIETLFFSANRTTGIKVAEARGTALYVASKAGLRIVELSPQQVKVAVTGDGRSDKAGVMKMIPRLVAIDKAIEHDDEYDAIAIGIACLATHNATLARS
jgi:crossover junction endodeoxyribonuclease RuvC